MSTKGYHYVAVKSNVFSSLPWKDQNSIVIYEGCHTSLYVQNFNAREALGYGGACPGKSPAEWKDFWERLSGAKDSGAKRNVGDAYQATFVPASGTAPSVILTSREDGKTVLSPAVASCSPSRPMTVGQTTTVKVVFDAPMLRYFQNRIPQVAGCDARITNTQFVDEYTLTFEVTPRKKGRITIAVKSEWARSKDWWSIQLDERIKRDRPRFMFLHAEFKTWSVPSSSSSSGGAWSRGKGP